MLFRKGYTLKTRLYSSGEFARRASVSVRTLRYYDSVGLLCPSERLPSGYRRYADGDLMRLQQILALKFLGLSLEEIRSCLRTGPRQLEPHLKQLRALMEERRRQLDTMVQAIAETQELMRTGRCDWDAIARVVEVIQMEQKSDWVKKYFSDDQLVKLNELSESSYSEEASARLRERGEWTEQDQERATGRWSHVYSEATRLAAQGVDPAGDEAQDLARLKSELLLEFTQGDSGITSGLSSFWQSYHALPAGEQPLTHVLPKISPEGEALLSRAMEIYEAGR